MAKCPLCSRRSAKRHCPAKGVKICPTCCGTHREVEIECPSDCTYLRAGRTYDAGRRHPAPPPPEREFSQQFRHRYAGAIAVLAQGILAERHDNPSLYDSDVREAFKALKATAKTRASGIYYETLPEGSAASMGLYRRIQGLIDRMMQPQAPGADALRAGDAPDVLDFIAVSMELRSGGRPKSRQYLDWLSSVAPPPMPGEPGELIAP